VDCRHECLGSSSSRMAAIIHFYFPFIQAISSLMP